MPAQYRKVSACRGNSNYCHLEFCFHEIFVLELGADSPVPLIFLEIDVERKYNLSRKSTVPVGHVAVGLSTHNPTIQNAMPVGIPHNNEALQYTDQLSTLFRIAGVARRIGQLKSYSDSINIMSSNSGARENWSAWTRSDPFLTDSFCRLGILSNFRTCKEKAL